MGFASLYPSYALRAAALGRRRGMFPRCRFTSDLAPLYRGHTIGFDISLATESVLDDPLRLNETFKSNADLACQTFGNFRDGAFTSIKFFQYSFVDLHLHLLPKVGSYYQIT